MSCQLSARAASAARRGVAAYPAASAVRRPLAPDAGANVLTVDAGSLRHQPAQQGDQLWDLQSQLQLAKQRERSLVKEQATIVRELSRWRAAGAAAAEREARAAAILEQAPSAGRGATGPTASAAAASSTPQHAEGLAVSLSDVPRGEAPAVTPATHRSDSISWLGVLQLLCCIAVLFHAWRTWVAMQRQDQFGGDLLRTKRVG